MGDEKVSAYVSAIGDRPVLRDALSDLLSAGDFGGPKIERKWHADQRFSAASRLSDPEGGNLSSQSDAHVGGPRCGWSTFQAEMDTSLHAINETTCTSSTPHDLRPGNGQRRIWRYAIS